MAALVCESAAFGFAAVRRFKRTGVPQNLAHARGRA